MNIETYKKILGRKIKISGIEKSNEKNLYIGYAEESGAIVYLLSENIKEAQVVAVIFNTVGNTEILVAAEKGTIILEPYIKEKIGDSSECKYFCLYEKTCGSIVYTFKNNIKYYLLVENDSGHIGFPKGHIELNESEEETACREVFEETGLEIFIDRNTRQEYTYLNSNGVYKNCVYFYSEFKEKNIKIQESEILNFWLVTYDEALKLLNYPQDKIVLEKADLMYD